MKFANLVSDDVSFLVEPKWKGGSSGIAGIFGTYFLAAYDVELDPLHKKVNFFDYAKDCADAVVYWADEAVTIPFSADPGNHIIFKALLDGKPVNAMLDTGASGIAITAPAAKRLFGFDYSTANSDKALEVAGATGETITAYTTHFNTFEVEGLAFKNLDAIVIPDKMTLRSEVRGVRTLRNAVPHSEDLKAEVIFGLKYLKNLRVFIAFSQSKMYVTAAGASKAPSSAAPQH